AGRNPYDRALTDLIGELSTRSKTFRTRWAAHDVRFHRTGRKQLHHPVVGDLDLSFEAMELPGEDLTVLAYTAEPGSPSQGALDRLVDPAAVSQPPQCPGLAVDRQPDRLRPTVGVTLAIAGQLQGVGRLAVQIGLSVHPRDPCLKCIFGLSRHGCGSCLRTR